MVKQRLLNIPWELFWGVWFESIWNFGFRNWVKLDLLIIMLLIVVQEIVILRWSMGLFLVVHLMWHYSLLHKRFMLSHRIGYQLYRRFTIKVIGSCLNPELSINKLQIRNIVTWSLKLEILCRLFGQRIGFLLVTIVNYLLKRLVQCLLLKVSLSHLDWICS